MMASRLSVCPPGLAQAAFRMYAKLQNFEEFDYGYTLKVRERERFAQEDDSFTVQGSRVEAASPSSGVHRSPPHGYKEDDRPRPLEGVRSAYQMILLCPEM